MKNTTGVIKRCISLALIAVMALSLAGCKEEVNEGIQVEGGSAPAQTGAAGEKIVDIGVISSLNTLNSLLVDGAEMNKHATDPMFPPLMDLDKGTDFEGVLADSIAAEDGSNFPVYIDDQAIRSNGTPVTADDMIYTVLCICSPVIGNVVTMYYVFEDVGDDGFVEVGVDHVEGITKVGDKTVRFTVKVPMPLITSRASYARYLMPLPKYVIENISERNLISDPQFNKLGVVSGPYRVTEFGRDHYVAYEANEDHRKGAPKIDRLNTKIVEGNQLYAGLKSGGVDVAQNTMNSISLEDHGSAQPLENANVSFGDLIINQSVLTRTSNIPDAKVRQVMLYVINRRQTLDQLLKDNGEVSEGSLSSASPYFDESITPVTYGPKKAKTLLEKSGWDKDKTIKFCTDSGDSTSVNAASVITAQWAAVGTKADIQTMDIDTLLGNVNKEDFDVMAAQYTYPPVDPYADVTWLLSGEGSWTEYSNNKVDKTLSKAQFSSDIGELKGLYSVIDKQVQEDVPVFPAYIIETMAAVNERLTGAGPSVYGSLNHTEQWDIAQ